MPIAPSDDVLVIGAGAMGSGIAQVAAAAGHRVGLYDVQAGAVDKAVAAIGAGLARLVERGKMTAEAKDALVARLVPVAALKDFAQAKLAVEAVKEDLCVKQALFRELEGLMPADAILATNTSSISITAIGSALTRPERLAGLHFFNPAPVMALVEVVTGLATAPEVAETLMQTAAAWGKRPVMARSTPGFIVNRVARPYYGEGLRVLQEGLSDPATLDAVMREAMQFRMGPFELMDLVGLDVNFAVTRSVHAAYFGDPRFQPSILQQEMVDAGRYGRKTGRGWYDYAEGAEKPAPQDAPEGLRPTRAVVRGEVGPLEPLLPMLVHAGVEIERQSEGPGLLVIHGVAVAATDGRSATERAAAENYPDFVVVDAVLDWATATRVAIAPAEQAGPEAAPTVAGLLQALGKRVSILADVPGLMAARALAMLANEAADAVMQGVATAEGVDTAMRLGVNYPVGPLAWADQVGAAHVVRFLDNLARTYGEDRYRASALLRRVAARGGRFHPAR